jgi:hypothetical protein
MLNWRDEPILCIAHRKKGNSIYTFYQLQFFLKFFTSLSGVECIVGIYGTSMKLSK